MTSTTRELVEHLRTLARVPDLVGRPVTTKALNDAAMMIETLESTLEMAESGLKAIEAVLKHDRP